MLGVVSVIRGLLAVSIFLQLLGCDTSLVNSSATPSENPEAEKSQNTDWSATGRTPQETRFSPLSSINDANISQLGLQWSFDLDTNKGQEATPLLVDGVLYVTSAWSKLHAFNPVTGELLWQYDPEVPKDTLVKACCDAVNRGAAYFDGKIFFGTLDGRLIAVDAKTGRSVWSTLTVDPTKSYTITGAPRVAEGLVFIGNGGAEMGVRGYITAYDTDTGEKVWRFYTVPGEPGKEDGEVSDAIHKQLAGATWNGEYWNKAGGYGGGTVWDSMAYDPESGYLLFGVGNASYWNKKYRSNGDNDNLFVASIVAVKASTGEYVWHYQATPGDAWDYTSTQHIILTTLTIDGADRKVLMQAPKNGYFYVIDRFTGKLISAENYVPVNWSDGIDLETGRPRIKPEAYYWKNDSIWVATPSPFGGHNWHPMSFSEDTGLVYIPAQEIPGVYKPDDAFKPMPIGLNLGLDMRTLILPDDPETVKAIKSTLKGYLLAWDPVLQEEVWRAPHRGPWNGGVLSTSGNLVFQGDVDGVFKAFNARTGELLWQFDSGNMISAAPITYSVDGVQYVTVLSGYGTAWSKLAGQVSWDDVGPGMNTSRVLTFALGGTATIDIPQRRLPVLGALPEPVDDQDAVSLGEKLYHHSCFGCHGAGAIAESLSPPDLRYSGFLHSKAAWASVVSDGILKDRGMVSFEKNFTPAEVEAIRAYVIQRAHTTLNKN